jgi:hypothetical protein
MFVGNVNNFMFVGSVNNFMFVGSVNNFMFVGSVNNFMYVGSVNNFMFVGSVNNFMFVGSVNNFITISPRRVIEELIKITLLIWKIFPKENGYVLRHRLKLENFFKCIDTKLYLKLWIRINSLLLSTNGGGV